MLKRITLTLFYTLNICLFAHAQSGCTDAGAINYSPTATINDGSCMYATTYYNPALRAYFNSSLSSCSGVVYTDGKLWVFNDSGNSAKIYRVDTTSATILQTVVVDNFPNVDWEDIAADSTSIYIGDFGNNNGDRTDLKILKIAKSAITNASTVHVNAVAINFSYTDQTNFISSSTSNYDCEALITLHDSLYVFTKDRGDFETRVYKMPNVPGTYAVSPYTTYNTNGLVTGADYNAATNEITLIGYQTNHLNNFLYVLNDFNGDDFFSGNKRRIEIGNTQDWQTEGITYQSNKRYFITCETTGSINASLYTAVNTWAVTTGTATLANKTNIEVYPNPCTDVLKIDNNQNYNTYSIYNLIGNKIKEGSLQNNANINVKQLSTGFYFLALTQPNGSKCYIKFSKN